MKTISSENSVFSYLKKLIKDYLNDKIYLLLLILTAIGSYGYLLTHYAVGIDDMAYDFFYHGGLIAQGRVTATVINWFFGLVKNEIWIQEFIGIVALCLSAIMFCTIFDRFIKTKNKIPQIAFSCIFVSFPLHLELFSKTGTVMMIGVCCCCISIALLFSICFQECKKIKYLIFSTLWVIPVISWYESVLLIYVSFVFVILLLDQMKNGSYKIKNFVIVGFQYAIPLIAGFIIEFVISNVIKHIFHLENAQNYAANTIMWDFSSLNSFFGCIYNIFYYFIKKFIRLFYFPITALLVCCLILFVFAIYYLIKTKKIGYSLSIFGIIFSVFALGFISASDIKYRTMQSAAFAVAFTIYFLIFKLSEKETKKVLYKTFCGFIIILNIWQISNINFGFTSDYLRYEYEKNISKDVAVTLREKYNTDKQVVFVGKIKMPEELKKRMGISLPKNGKAISVLDNLHISSLILENSIDYEDSYFLNYYESMGNSYINWAVLGVKQKNDFYIKFLRFLGYDDIKQCTEEQYVKANAEAENMKQYPENGYIKDMGDYIIVNFGVDNPQWISW